MEINNLLKMYNFLNTRFNNQNRNISIIKSNLMYKFNVSANEEYSVLDVGSAYCSWCFNLFSPGACEVMLKPQKHPKKSLRSLMMKDPTSLNSFQQKLVARLKSKPKSNLMVYKCRLCSKSTPVTLKKPTVDSKSNKSFEINIEEPGKKKKRKKKDMFAGLNVGAVQSVRNAAISIKNKQPNNVKQTAKTLAKKLSMKEQFRINRALLQAPVQKKKPSLLAAFLDNSM